MTPQAKCQTSTYQGRADYTPMDPEVFRRRMRLPVATLGVGLVAALAIAGGVLDPIVGAHQLTDGLSELEFLTGELPQSE